MSISHQPLKFEPLERQATLPLADPVGLVAALPQLEPRLSNTSRVSLSRSQSDTMREEKWGRVDPVTGPRRASDIPEGEGDGDDEEKQDERDRSTGAGTEEGLADVGATGKDVPPNGGFKAWTVVFGAFLTVFVGFGMISGIGAFQTYYRTELLSTYSDSQVSWIISVQTFLTFAASCFTGSLFDKYGHRPLIASGTFSLVLGFCMLSLCKEYYQLMLVHASFLPIGCNLLFICPIAVVGQWFSTRRGLAFGLMSTGSSIGSIIWPLLLANLPQRIGFPWTIRLFALLCGILGVASFFLLTTRLPPKPPGSFFYLQAFKNPQYTLTVLNFALIGYGFFAYLTFIGTYGQLAGLGAFAPYLLIIQNAGSIIGRLGSVLADKIGAYNSHISGNIIFVLMYFVWLACKTQASLIVLVIILGIAGGSFVTLQPPLAVMTATDMRYAGTYVGQSMFCMSLAQLASGPSFGALLGNGTPEDRYDNFPKGIILSACLAAVGTASIMVARSLRSRKLFAKA